MEVDSQEEDVREIEIESKMGSRKVEMKEEEKERSERRWREKVLRLERTRGGEGSKRKRR